jgi:hypothetical protein
MKKLLFTLSGLMFAAFAAAPFAFAAKADRAKPNPIAKYDTNKNGKLDPEEYAAVRTDFAAKPDGDLAKLDLDHDGKLSDTEVAALGATGKKKGKGDTDRAEKKAKRAERNKATSAPSATPPTETK